MRAGRPLRFLALTLGAWTTARVVVLWPEAADEAVAASTLTRSPDAVATVGSTVRAASDRGHLSAIVDGPVAPRPMVRLASAASTPDLASALPPQSAAGKPVTEGRVSQQSEASRAIASPPPFPYSPPSTPERARATTSRLRGDAWLVARSDGGDDLAFGQLGGSQAGLRLTYAVDDARRVALSARVSTPLRGRGREAAVGIDWRPTALPIHLLVEQRLPLDGGPARPAAQLIAGVARRLPLGFQLDAYGQAGAVYRRGGFADGAARVARPVLATRVATIDAGAGVWGAAQRGAARVDVGPTLGVALPVGRVGLRFSADYRVRVAGEARPGSGPALTLGAGF